MANPKNIIVRMPNWIGDAVMGSPILEDLKKAFPDVKVTAMCQGVVGQLFSKDPYVDEVFSFQKPNGWIHHLHVFPLIEDLQKGNYDTGILLTNSLSSAWWFYRGHVQNRIGFGGRLRHLLLNQAVKWPQDVETRHLVSTYKLLLEPLGISPSESLPKLYLAPEENKDARLFLRKQGVPDDALLVGINPGAAYGSAKCWLPERFHEVAKTLLEHPRVWVVFFGDAKGRELTEQIAQGLQERTLNLAGKTSLRELMALIANLNVLLTNDSGPMHMASALNIPLVALFGSTSAIKTGPLGPSQVIHKQVACSPCYKRVCPIDFKCMTRIETAEVIAAIQAKLPL